MKKMLDKQSRVVYNISAFQRQQVALRKSCRGLPIDSISTVFASFRRDRFLFLFERIPIPANLMEVKTRMPNAKVLSEKQAIVADLTDKLKNAAAGVLVDYKGITVAEDTALRAELRKNNVDYAVVKNTLLRFAVDNCGMNELDGLLSGTTSLAVCNDDPVAPARVVNDFAKKIEGRFEIKGGFMEGKAIPLEEVMALAAIPPLPVLQAQVLGTMLAPISALACVIKQIAEKQGAPADGDAAPAAAE